MGELGPGKGDLGWRDLGLSHPLPQVLPSLLGVVEVLLCE
jgi:hypothetical protein